MAVSGRYKDTKHSTALVSLGGVPKRGPNLPAMAGRFGRRVYSLPCVTLIEPWMGGILASDPLTLNLMNPKPRFRV